MPPEVYLTCPKCGHEYNIHASAYARGPEFPMFCPLCNATFPQKDGRVAASTAPFPGGEKRD